jgi:hypothetical protein
MSQEPQYLAHIDSDHATVDRIYSSDFEYCFSALIQQMVKGPYRLAQVIDTITNQAIIVMRVIR